jgi:hypothetical protein
MQSISRVLVTGISALATAVAVGGQTDEEAARAAGATLIPAEALGALYLGRVVVGITPGGYRFETRVEADGQIPATERRGAGRFEVQEDGRACMQFADVWEGELRCWTYYRVGDEIHMFREDGALAAQLDDPPPE